MISPIFFDPEASCPRFEQFLAEIFPEDTKDISAFIQRAAGYSLSGEIREECFFVGYGAGRNGKGKFVDALMHVMGEYAKPAPFDIFVAKKGDEGKPNDIADLFGARFVAASEGDQSKRLNEAKLKALVSGDMVTGEKKYQDAFHFRPNYKIWLFSNYKPRIVGTDEGIWDKIFMVGFDRYFAPEHRDRHLLDKLKAEAAGILNWLIKGCLEWQRIGLAAPDCIKQRTQEYRAEQDVLSHFIEDELETEAGATTGKSETYSRYSAWAERMGEFVMTASEFTERMGRLFQEKRVSKGKVWMGFRLKSYRDASLAEVEDRWSGEESMQNIPDVLPGQHYAVMPTYDQSRLSS
jgi:putative DNA primase/helicase